MENGGSQVLEVRPNGDQRQPVPKERSNRNCRQLAPQGETKQRAETADSLRKGLRETENSLLT